MLDSILNLGQDDADAFVKANNGIVIFHKTLCPHCKVMGKVLLKVQEMDADIKIASIDSEADAPLLEKFNITRVPTLMVIKDGEQKATHAGVMKPQELLNFYKNA